MEVAHRICLLKDIRLLHADKGVAMMFSVDASGYEDELLREVASNELFDKFSCENCGWDIDVPTSGDHFAEVRQHLGKRNKFLHPYGGHLLGTPSM